MGRLVKLGHLLLLVHCQISRTPGKNLLSSSPNTLALRELFLQYLSALASLPSERDFHFFVLIPFFFTPQFLCPAHTHTF